VDKSYDEGLGEDKLQVVVAEDSTDEILKVEKAPEDELEPYDGKYFFLCLLNFYCSKVLSLPGKVSGVRREFRLSIGFELVKNLCLSICHLYLLP